jgi:hypothetical protein
MSVLLVPVPGEFGVTPTWWLRLLPSLAQAVQRNPVPVEMM